MQQAVYLNPVLLPCGNSICKEHVESKPLCEPQNKRQKKSSEQQKQINSSLYKCDLCKASHLIPENGFIINRYIIDVLSTFQVETNDISSDQDENSSEAKTFQLVIRNLAKFKENKQYTIGPAFMIRELPWKICARSETSTKRLSFYLECITDKFVYANVEFILLNCSNPEKNFAKYSEEVFSSEDKEWGFTGFITMKVNSFFFFF